MNYYQKLELTTVLKNCPNLRKSSRKESALLEPLNDLLKLNQELMQLIKHSYHDATGRANLHQQRLFASSN